MARNPVYRPWAGDPWGAFDDLHSEMDALLGRFGTVRPTGRGAVFPAVNLYEASDAYVLTAELPGVRPEDIQVSVEGASVALRGERKIEYPTDGTSIHRLERRSGSFRRAFELPVTVDADKAEAIHRNGVLMLRLPKAPEHRPRRITVQAS